MKIRLQNVWPAPLVDDVPIARFPSVLGRGAGCDLSVPFGVISRRHCRFVRRGDEVLVQDLESCNGTFVNGRPAHFLTPLRHGDELLVGLVCFRVSVSSGCDGGGLPLRPSSEVPAG